MTILQALGYVLIAAPFVGMFVLGSYLESPMAMLGVFATTAAIIGVVVAGCYLAAG